MILHSILKSKVTEWRNLNCKSKYPVIFELLNLNYSFEAQICRFLRKSKFETLEAYWYLRLMEKIPHIFDLYKRLYNAPVELFKASGISTSQEDLLKIISKKDIDLIFAKIKIDDEFVRKYRLETLRKTLSLTYPSYVLILAMGAGKTILDDLVIYRLTHSLRHSMR